MRYIFFILILLGTWGRAQVVEDSVVVDSGERDSIKIFRPSINDYQHFTQFSERQVFDTVFTVEKYYRFTRYNNKDAFGKIPFSNIGAGFQDLVYRTDSEGYLALYPTQKTHFILGIKDVKYYDVKTPTTAFYFHNGMNNGGALQSTYTQNIGKRFNFAVEYMGLRSDGFYQRDLASSNTTLFSAHYTSENSKYQAFGHFIHQNILNEENGGIADLQNFTSGDSRFSARQNLAVNLANTHSRFSMRRYYFSHNFTPFDAEKYPFSIKHTFYHQANKYYYTEETAETYYPSATFANYPTNSKKISENLSNTINLVLGKENLKLEAGVRHQLLKYKAGFPLIVGGRIEDSEFKENRLGVVGNLKIKFWDKANLTSSLEFSNGKAFGNYLHSENQLVIEPVEGYFLNARLNFSSVAPSFNYLMNASYYADYNYKYTDFKNQNILEVGADLKLKWFDSKFFVNYFRIDQMPYFDVQQKPQQSTSAVNVSQIGGEATFSLAKFHLNTRLLFQSVLSNRELLPLPEWLGRVNLYYQTKAFKKAAELQTGIKAYYFSKFATRDYFPLLNEFVLPSATSYSIGGQPIVDVYFNFKVKRMMVFIEAQHLNTAIMKNQSYAAPYHPVADFRLNLGVVWYLFH